MPAGRPTTYKPEYCDLLLDHMKSGLSFESFGAIADCCEDTLFEWLKKHKEFSESYKKGISYSRKFWEDLGLVGTTEGKNFNATTWIFNMKNRFGWKDRNDFTSGDRPIDISSVIQIVDAKN